MKRKSLVILITILGLLGLTYGGMRIIKQDKSTSLKETFNNVVVTTNDWELYSNVVGNYIYYHPKDWYAVHDQFTERNSEFGTTTPSREKIGSVTIVEQTITPRELLDKRQQGGYIEFSNYEDVLIDGKEAIYYKYKVAPYKDTVSGVGLTTEVRGVGVITKNTDNTLMIISTVKDDYSTVRIFKKMIESVKLNILTAPLTEEPSKE